MGKILLHEESEATVSDSFLKDTRANAQGRIIGLIWRKGLGTSREDISGNGRRACEPEFNYKGCEQSRSEMERWTGTPEGTWNVLRMFRETHAISAIVSSTTGYEGERLATIHSANCGSLDWYDAKDSERVVQNPSQCEGFGSWALQMILNG